MTTKDNKDKVREVIESIMKKLDFNTTLDEIIERYNDKNRHLLPGIVLQKFTDMELSEKEKPSIPECAKKVYFPWCDVLASMHSFPTSVHITEKICPECGEKLIILNFCSPAWTWQALCGRSGIMEICPGCPRQTHFSLRIMN